MGREQPRLIFCMDTYQQGIYWFWRIGVRNRETGHVVWFDHALHGCTNRRSAEKSAEAEVLLLKQAEWSVR